MTKPTPLGGPTPARVPPIRTADPSASYLAYQTEIDDAVHGVLHGGDHSLGPTVERFERAFAETMGARHAVGVNSGTDAIHLALRALGIGPGDDVVTVSHTAVATVAAIEMSGASAVLVDVEPSWLTIDPEAAAQALTPRTRAIVAVHLYGQPADLSALAELCRRRDIALVEDCAQALGASWRRRAAGSFGAAACFSFYPTKTLGTVGDGGMVTTADTDVAHRLTELRQYGWSGDRISHRPGFNSRLGPLQAAILSVKLGHLGEIVAQRRAIASRYTAALAATPLILPSPRPDTEHAYTLYVVRCREEDERDALAAHLAARGILAGVHYPVPVHRQPAYRGRLRTGPLPVTEHAATQVLSLPIYPELTEAQQDAVVTAVAGFFGSAG